MNQGPDFRHFVAFVAVAEQLSFGRAANQLHITQPALSAQIKQLEDWHGERLFKRGHAGAELTESGRSFLVWARQILHMRGDAFSSTSRKHSPAKWAFRLGYSPYAHHALVHEALKGYREIVPERGINSSSDCSAELVNMLNDGRLDAAIVTLPIFESELSEHEICADRLLVCLRADDPVADASQVPRSVLSDRLKIMFRRDFHPLLYDRLLKKFKAVGVHLRPTETYSAPSEMQFLVETSGCFGLIREGRALEPGLKALPIEGMNLRVRTALVFNASHQAPVLPMLARRMTQRCIEMSLGVPKRKPVSNVPEQGNLNFERRA
jgi:DNA-binding transcriptional LysR family regulator